MTFAEEIEHEAHGHEIIGVVLGDSEYGHIAGIDTDHYGIGDSDNDLHPNVRKDLWGQLLTWDEARPILDYGYDGGFGGTDCHAMWAWTEYEVLYVAEYDGSTQVKSIPRNPIAITPEMS